MLRKMFRERPPQQWKIVEKDLVDEIIFRTMKPRNRIMLELMAWGGMRVGDVLKIRPMDIQDRKITLPGPKSVEESKVVFIPQKVADRLKECVKESGTGPEERPFPISYNAESNRPHFILSSLPCVDSLFLSVKERQRFPSRPHG